MRIFFAVVFILSLMSLSVNAQDTVYLSSGELLAKVVQQNLQSKLAQADVQLARVDILQTRAIYLPNITASYTASSTNNPLMAFGSKLNQSRVVMEDFNPSNLNHPNNIGNFASKIEIQQPIVNMDAVYQKKAALVKAQSFGIKSERIKEYLQMEASRAYMQLQLSYMAVQVLENAKSTTLENKRTVENYYRNGMIQKPDVLYMDIRVAEINSQLEQAQSNVRNASDYIHFLINEDGNNKIVKPTEALRYNEKASEAILAVNKQRKDILAYSVSLQAYDYLIKSAKAKFLPRLNAFGNFEVYDKNPLGFKANGYLAGIQLSWNVFDGMRSKSEQAKYKTESEKARTEIEQYTQQSQLEMNKAFRQLTDAKNKVSVGELSLEQAKEAYRIRKNRFDQGLEKPSDLLNAETFMSQKELEYYQAIYEYNAALEYYQFLK